MRKNIAISAFLLVSVLSCKTVGVSKTVGGYAEVAPTVANEMMLDTSQVVVLDVRSAEAYRGPAGHLPASISAPFETIERQLPELIPYQNMTVLIYGENSIDGAEAAKVLTLAGFRNIVHIAGGLAAWIERGYRTVHSR